MKEKRLKYQGVRIKTDGVVGMVNGREEGHTILFGILVRHPLVHARKDLPIIASTP